jgi:hypothetical protein
MRNSEDMMTPIKIEPSQELLIRAIISEDWETVEYCNEWLKNVDLDNIDGGSYRLIPMLYKKLESLEGINIKSDTMGRLKGIYRYFFYMNNLVIHRFSKTLEILNLAGFKVMLLKGIALVLGGYYKEYSLRPMNDVDIFIEEDRVGEAIRLLYQNGWKKFSSAPQFHEVGALIKVDGYVLDIHFHLLRQCCWKNIDSDLWEYANRIDFKGIPLYILDPADNIIQNCARGVLRSSIPSLRWIIDVITIIDKHEGSVDWERLINKAKKRLLTLTLLYTLRYVESIASGRVPEWVLAELKKVPVSKIEKILFNDLQKEHMTFRILWALHSTHTLHKNSFYRLVTFPLYIPSFFGLKNLFAFPGFLIKKMFRKILKLK